MKRVAEKRVKRERRHRRVRARIFGTSTRPRLSVFRSNRHVFAQLIDDEHRVTLASASDLVRGSRRPKTTLRPPRERAEEVGRALAAAAAAKGISHARFDRGRYRYHGLIAALAEGARVGGLQF